MRWIGDPANAPSQVVGTVRHKVICLVPCLSARHALLEAGHGMSALESTALTSVVTPEPVLSEGIVPGAAYP